MKVAHSCPTLCDPMDYTVHRILQARILEWVAYPFCSGSPWARNRTEFSMHCRGILYQLSYQGSPSISYYPWIESLHLLQLCFLNKQVLLFQLWFKKMDIDTGQVFMILKNWKPRTVVIYIALIRSACLPDMLYLCDSATQFMTQFC